MRHERELADEELAELEAIAAKYGAGTATEEEMHRAFIYRAVLKPGHHVLPATDSHWNETPLKNHRK
jgi:hypothetical protein